MYGAKYEHVLIGFVVITISITRFRYIKYIVLYYKVYLKLILYNIHNKEGYTTT